MPTRTIKIDLGPSEERETLTVEFTGCPCRTADFQMALIGFAKEWKRATPKERKVFKGKPCGCQDAN